MRDSPRRKGIDENVARARHSQNGRSFDVLESANVALSAEISTRSLEPAGNAFCDSAMRAWSDKQIGRLSGVKANDTRPIK